MKSKTAYDLGTGDLIKADLVSRPNFTNGKYRAMCLGLDDLININGSDVFFLETLRMKADLADKMIAEAESQGKDTTDVNALKELGERINEVCTPIKKNESLMTAFIVSMHLVAYYGIAIGIWGLVFNRSFLVFGTYGVIVGILISGLSVAPIIAFQRTKERIRDMVAAAGMLWGNLGIIIGIIGLVAWIIRLIFF